MVGKKIKNLAASRAVFARRIPALASRQGSCSVFSPPAAWRRPAGCAESARQAARYCAGKIIIGGCLCVVAAWPLGVLAAADDVKDTTEEEAALEINYGAGQDVLVDQQLFFDGRLSNIQDEDISEIVWDFGDGVRSTGQKTSHTYAKPGAYLVKVKVFTETDTVENTSEIRVYEHSIVLVADSSASTEQLQLLQQQAARGGVMLFAVKAKSDGPEALVEEELTSQLLDLRPKLETAHLAVMWTSGGVGANVLTKFAQHLKQAGLFSSTTRMDDKGIILLSETPLAVLKPAAQSAFDQLQPSYILLTRPQVIDSLITTTTADEAKEIVFTSPLDHKILGKFSARTVSDLGVVNFMSFGVNFLINRGVSINSIILILMLPVIATILSFSRQVIGIKSFGLITPAMTTLSFLVMGLKYGLIVFLTIVLAGTITRFILKQLRLLYLPRMALVLTSVSLSLLFLLALGVTNEPNNFLSFSIFPALILTLLAEDFIAAQFKLGMRTALILTTSTLVLATISYFIVSSEIFRTLVLSYPEIILLAIPINIGLGQWSGLRLTEYVRFRDLLRHGNNIS